MGARFAGLKLRGIGLRSAASAAVVVTVIATVAVPPAVSVGLLAKEQAASAGSPEQARLTWPAKAPTEVTVT